MTTLSDLSHTQNRRPLVALGKVAIGVLVGIALILAYTMIVVDRQPDMALFIFIAITLGCAGLIATGWRWAPLLATLMSVAMLGGYLPQIGTILTDHHRPDFVITVIFLPLAVVGIVSGIAATVQNYRSSSRDTPRWLPLTLAALAGLAIGAILITKVPHDDSGIGVSAESLASLPGIAITNFRFDQSEIRARAGEVIALRLDNHDTTPHSFDVDALNVHVPLSGAKSGLALFKPSKPGTYAIYCSVPGHREQGMVATLIVVP